MTTSDRSRYALYFTPAQGSSLERFGAAILGYDCYTGQTIGHPDVSRITSHELEVMTAEPRRYGFHATLKPPFELRSGQDIGSLKAAVTQLAASRPRLSIGPMKVAALGRFIALVPESPPANLGMLAAECVAALDCFRAPLSDADRQKRPAEGLSPRQRALQERWGYPYVFEEFRFHMTLSGRLPHERLPVWLEALASQAGKVSLTLDALTLLIQPHRDAPFRVLERMPLQCND